MLAEQRSPAAIDAMRDNIAKATTALDDPDADRERQRTDEQTRANIREAVDRINRQMQDSNRDLNFSVDDASDRIVITVKSARTGEVIRQIPNEVVVRVAHNIEKLKGFLFSSAA